jgi:hypothetical protein
MTIVSGMATRMMALPTNSGLSAIAPAIAAPILD